METININDSLYSPVPKDYNDNVKDLVLYQGQWYKPVDKILEPEWKILSFKMDKPFVSKPNFTTLRSNGLYVNDIHNPDAIGCYTLKTILDNPNWKIYSVEYKGEVFTISDETNYGKIVRFKLNQYQDLTVELSKNIGCYTIDISLLQKVIEKPVLFTSLDGQPIREGDRPWVWPRRELDMQEEIYQWEIRGITEKAFKDLRLFSTREAAENYKDLHEKKYSKADIENTFQVLLDSGWITKRGIEIFKEKLGI